MSESPYTWNMRVAVIVKWNRKRNLIVRSVMGEDDTSVGSASVTLGGPERGVTVTRGGPWQRRVGQNKESAAVSETARVENVNVLLVSTEKSVNAVTGTVALTMVCCVVDQPMAFVTVENALVIRILPGRLANVRHPRACV